MYQENVTALIKDAPIGVFDSGIGGLTVAREIIRQIPNEKIIYLGDTARMPYGSKSKETVTRFSKQIVRFMETFQVKTIVAGPSYGEGLSTGCTGTRDRCSDHRSNQARSQNRGGADTSRPHRRDCHRTTIAARCTTNTYRTD
jgi:Glutamate racemase